MCHLSKVILVMKFHRQYSLKSSNLKINATNKNRKRNHVDIYKIFNTMVMLMLIFYSRCLQGKPNNKFLDEGPCS